MGKKTSEEGSGQRAEFGARLRRWAESRFDSFGDCAEKVGIDQATLSKYMNAKREPCLEVLIRLQAAGFHISYGISGFGEMDYTVDTGFRYVDVNMSSLIVERLEGFIEEIKERIPPTDPSPSNNPEKQNGPTR